MGNGAMDQLKLSVCTYKNEIILVTDRSRYETQFSGLTLVVSLHGSKRTAKNFLTSKFLVVTLLRIYLNIHSQIGHHIS